MGLGTTGAAQLIHADYPYRPLSFNKRQAASMLPAGLCYSKMCAS